MPAASPSPAPIDLHDGLVHPAHQFGVVGVGAHEGLDGLVGGHRLVQVLQAALVLDLDGLAQAFLGGQAVGGLVVGVQGLGGGLVLADLLIGLAEFDVPRMPADRLAQLLGQPQDLFEVVVHRVCSLVKVPHQPTAGRAETQEFSVV